MGFIKYKPFCFKLLLTICGLICVQAQFPKPQYTFLNSKVLVEPDVYAMHWNYTKAQVIVELQVKTNGWLGFGLTKSGGMNGADVIIAWIDANGKVNFTDRHIVNRAVSVDDEQNWFLVSGKKANGYTSIVFKRDVQTCDSKEQDIDIEEGTPRVIFAWNNDIPTGDISYHGAKTRGVATVGLISTLNEAVVFTAQDNIKTYDFKVNAKIPDGWETYYHCEMFKLPTDVLAKKHHLLRTITKIPAGNEQLVHHWLLYYCDHKFENEYLKNYSVPAGGHCFDFSFTNSANKPNTWLTVANYCYQLGGIWAIGGDLVQDFPKDFGFPVGGANSDFSYFYLQMHYNNPQKLNSLTDNTVLQLYVTENLRKTEIGILQVGSSSDWMGITIPPGQESMRFSYGCKKDCINKWSENQDITVFAVAPHTHLTGIQVHTKLIRDGREVAYIDKASNFDFDYQTVNYLQNPIVIKPNDEIKIDCVYRTTNKTKYTFGGIGTPEEMCMDFLFYYPKKSVIGSCFSTYTFGEWWNLLKELNATGDIKLSQNQPLYQAILSDLSTLKASKSVTDKLTRFFQTSNQTHTCLGNNFFDSKEYPQLKAAPLVEINTCKNTSDKLFKITYLWLLLTIVVLSIIY